MTAATPAGVTSRKLVTETLPSTLPIRPQNGGEGHTTQAQNPT